MRHIKEVNHLAQNSLFDSAALDAASWWATDLDDSARRRLDEGWHGVFRRSLLQLMPAQQLGKHFADSFGRPTKELHAMAALVFIMEFKNWTNEDAVDAYTFDNSIHFALNLGNRRNYLCTRTLESYRALMRDDDAAGNVFMEVTRTLVEALKINISKQRLDSTHLLSDMACFGRTRLLAVAVKRLLTALKRHAAPSFEALSAELRERYEPSQGRLFGETGASKELRTQAQQQIAKDMHLLIERFADDANINTRSTYQALVRLFGEHCELTENEIKVRAKGQDAEGKSSHALQNSSDPDAGYSGHKGAGYQVQLSETSDAENPAQLVLACIPQSAGDQDADALSPVLEQLIAQQMQPSELAADSAYGSDENHQRAKSEGIALISPVFGNVPKEGYAGKQAKQDASAPLKRQGRYQATEQSQARQERARRLAVRREEQQSEEWKAKYRRRAGSESLNRGLDRRTGIKQLRVRGMKAVKHSVYAKVMGWNIIQSARVIRKAARAERKAVKIAVETYLEPIAKEYRAVTKLLLRSLAGIERAMSRQCAKLTPTALLPAT
ncbi:MAG: transposase [Verrucomicrobia bacterium]|nr:transposase [Verrucomicrobiota bacterium]